MRYFESCTTFARGDLERKKNLDFSPILAVFDLDGSLPFFGRRTTAKRMNLCVSKKGSENTLLSVDRKKKVWNCRKCCRI